MKVMLSVFALVLAALAFYLTPNFGRDAEGFVTVEIIDEEGTLVRQETLEFSLEDTLLSLLEAHFELQKEQQVLGTLILGIEGLETDFQHSFIEIRLTGYVSDDRTRFYDYEASPVGVDRIALIDGNTYHFIKSTVNGGG